MNTQYSNENFREFLDRLSREQEPLRITLSATD